MLIDFPEVKLEIFVPAEFVVPLRDELSRIGAGHIGAYDHCCSITDVRGTWRPLEDANPYLGSVGEICEGSECKLEMNCKSELVPKAIKAIHRIHPYEEPVINIVQLLNHLYR